MGYTCRTCGAWHNERPQCFGAELPAIVAAVPPDELQSRVQRSSDQCILDGEHSFILGNVDVPMLGSEDPLRWTVWTGLSAKDFERASALTAFGFG